MIEKFIFAFFFIVFSIALYHVLKWAFKNY